MSTFFISYHPTHYSRRILSSLGFMYTANHATILSIFVFFFLVQVGAQPSSDPRADPYRYDLSPSVAIIIVVLIAALFFMAFFSVYIRHCSGSSSVSSTLNSARSRRAAAARGLDRTVIETFPTLIYSEIKEHKIGKSLLECAVCLNEFEDDETLRLIPKCDHVFHPECIDAWFESHTTCPVCRANLVPQPGESANQLPEFNTESDIEAQNDVQHQGLQAEQEVSEPEASNMNKTLNRDRTRGSRSNRVRWLFDQFPRSHSTGHSLVQRGEDMERFTLRLPVEVRKQIMNRRLKRATSMVVLPRESSSRRGFRIGGEGSSRGKSYRRLKSLDRPIKSDRWVFSRTPSFFVRMLSMKSPRATNGSEGGSVRDGGSVGSSVEPVRPQI